MYNTNPILDTDSYKLGHFLQLPPGTTSMFSYVESRGGLFDHTLFFGLQPILHDLAVPFTDAHVTEAEEFCAAHGEPCPTDGLRHIVRAHGGRWPVRIRALDEGSVVPTHVPLVTAESTDPRVPWVGGLLETRLMRVWYPTTVATLSWHAKQVISKYLELTADGPWDGLAFKLHDFGSRGVSSRESAALGGAAHLVNFQGSDTIEGVLFANQAYGFSPGYAGPRMAGFSIPASEHSTITSWGREHEVDAYSNMIDRYGKPGAVFACVSDSYDLMHAIDALWGGVLREKVIASGATLVVRPDSGDPVQIVRETLMRLDARFGHTINAKGYKVLNHVRVIQGDGINLTSINAILLDVMMHGYSAANLAFGMGGALLQGVNRDTQRFAMKCSSITVDGQERDVFKDPVTDPGKRSKPGRLDVLRTGELYRIERLDAERTSVDGSAMQTVFENGKVLVHHYLDEVRTRSEV